MSVEIKRRRGTTEEHSFFTGAVGELTVDTIKNTVVVHDGVTLGGFPLAHEAYVEQINQELRNLISKSVVNPEEPTEETVLINKEFQSYCETLKVVDNASGPVYIDFSVANVYQVHMTGNINIVMMKNNVPAGKAVALSLIIKQSATARSVVWPQDIKWSRNDIPTLLAGGKTYVFTLLTTNGGQSWIGLLVGEEIDA